jgi:hypothetical protein
MGTAEADLCLGLALLGVPAAREAALRGVQDAARRTRVARN